MADVGNILDAVQRARLIAIQKTARALDVASARLSTGQKVTSVLDNPQNFFAARTLRNRASDLTRLLDNVGQNIQAIKVADQAIRAQIHLLDQAEAYLTDLESKYMAGEIESSTGTGLAPNETLITFAGPGDFIQYIAGQDMAATGAPVVTGDNQVTISGNRWLRKAFNYNITADTVMTFEYSSTLIPEVSTIGFDNDANFGNDNRRFWIYGTQIAGITYAAATTTYDYTGTGGEWQTIEIPVGQHFTGSFNYINFVNDDDVGPYGNASFRNIILREGPKQEVASDGAAYLEDYRDILNQFDMIAEDASYRSVNLLKGRDMTTYFNEDRSSSLFTEAMESTYVGLGIDADNLNSLATVQEKLQQIQEAHDKLREYLTTLAGDLNIIQARQDFMKGQIEVNNEGADFLTLADMNEEGANLLALQTRQQLQMSILSLRPPSIFDVLT